MEGIISFYWIHSGGIARYSWKAVEELEIVDNKQQATMGAFFSD